MKVQVGMSLIVLFVSMVAIVKVLLATYDENDLVKSAPSVSHRRGRVIYVPTATVIQVRCVIYRQMYIPDRYMYISQASADSGVDVKSFAKGLTIRDVSIMLSNRGEETSTVQETTYPQSIVAPLSAESTAIFQVNILAPLAQVGSP